MNSPATVADLLDVGASDAPAIGAPGRRFLSFRELRRLIVETGEALAQAEGIGRCDRVAIVLPNGAEAATAFLTIACYATTAPLNPAYKTDEFFAFYLSDLKAKALVVQQAWRPKLGRLRRRKALRSSNCNRILPLPAGSRCCPNRIGPPARSTSTLPARMTSRWSCTRQALPRVRKSFH